MAESWIRKMIPLAGALGLTLACFGYAHIPRDLQPTLDLTLARHEEQRIGHAQESVQPRQGKTYAVLVNGLTSDTTTRLHMQLGIESLRAVGVDELILLDDTHNAQDSTGPARPATFETLYSTLADLESQVSSDDVLFLYATGHGAIAYNPGTNKQEAGTVIDGEFLPGSILMDQLSRIHPNFGVVVLTGCYQAEIAERIVTALPEYIAITPSRKEHMAFAIWEAPFGILLGPDFSCGLFTAILQGASLRTTQQNPSPAPTSIARLFEFASDFDDWSSPLLTPYKETPQLYWNKADPHMLSLFGPQKAQTIGQVNK